MLTRLPEVESVLQAKIHVDATSRVMDTGRLANEKYPLFPQGGDRAHLVIEARHPATAFNTVISAVHISNALQCFFKRDGFILGGVPAVAMDYIETRDPVAKCITSNPTQLIINVDPPARPRRRPTSSALSIDLLFFWITSMVGEPKVINKSFGSIDRIWERDPRLFVENS